MVSAQDHVTVFATHKAEPTRVRSRQLRLARDAAGRPVWGGGVYSNELVKQDGVWRFNRVTLEDEYEFDYRDGWDTINRNLRVTGSTGRSSTSTTSN